MLMLIKDMYLLYRKEINDDIEVLNERLDKIVKSKRYAYAVLYKNKDNFDDIRLTFIDVTIAMDSPNKDMFGPNPILKISRSYHSNPIKTYLKIFYRCAIIELDIKAHIRRLENARMPLYVYLRTLKSVNLDIAAAILKGYSYRFGKNLSFLEIMLKPRHKNPDSKFNHKVINWGESNKLKQQLINDGKTIRTKDNPKGENWLIYYNDAFNCWWTWNKSYTTVKNKTKYSFKPTTGFHITGAINVEYGTNGETIDEIVNTTEVGNVQKLQGLLRRDELYFLNYKR